MRRTLIYLTITVVLFTLLTAVMTFSYSVTNPIKLYWAVDCTNGNSNCKLIISGINFIGEVEDENETNTTENQTTIENNYALSGSITPEEAVNIDKPSKIPWYSKRLDITSVKLGDENDVIVPANMFAWFYGMENLLIVDFSHVNSSASNTFSYLFYGCESLSSIDLSPLAITQEAAENSFNVYSFTYLRTIRTSSTYNFKFEYGFWDDGDNTYYYKDLSGIASKTYENVTPKYYYKIQNGTLTITSTPTEGYLNNYESSIPKWFNKYTGELEENITSVVTNDFNPKSVYGLFSNLTNVTSIDLSGIDTTETIDMEEWFYNCKRLKTLDLSNVTTAKIEENSGIDTDQPSSLFVNCISLVEVTIGENFGYPLSEGTWRNSRGRKYTNGLIVTNVNETYIRNAVFWNVKNNTLNLYENYDSDSEVFYYSDAMLSNANNIPWNSYKGSVTKINIGKASEKVAPTDMTNWFNGFTKVETIDFKNLDASSIEVLESTFEGMTHLKSIDFSGLNFESLEIADKMFKGCTSLEYVNLSGFNPENLLSTYEMFSGCSLITHIDLSSFEGDLLEMADSMFSNCTSLEILNIEKMLLNDSNNTYDNIFENCNKLAEITIGPRNAGVIATILPNPNPDYVTGSDGLWHDYSGPEVVNYEASNLPTNVVGTYYAIPPKTVSFYYINGNDKVLIKEEKHIPNSSIKLSINYNKPNEISTVTTTFDSGNTEVISPLESSTTTYYELGGYTVCDPTTSSCESAEVLPVGSDYILSTDVAFYLVYNVKNIEYGEIVLPTPADWFGYIFLGWAENKNETSGITGTYHPHNNMTFYAIWKEIKHEYLDNTGNVKFVLGKTKSLRFRIDADVSLFKDLYVGNNKLEKDTHYTVTSGSTVIDFTEAGLNYLTNLGPGQYEIRAEFTDTGNKSVANVSVEEIGKHILTIHYKYSGKKSDVTASDNYNVSLEEGQTYSVNSPKIDYYKADQEIVSGIMGDSNIEITVRYIPINDKNKNGVADELDPKPENTEKSPKTRDNIITYLILEVISLVAAVIIFIRIKAQ